MGRPGEKVRTEFELQQEADRYFKKNRYAFLICSSTNLDTLASFYQAALKNKMYTYCYSKYLLLQLKTFSETAGTHSSLYKFEEAYLAEFDKMLMHEYWKEPKTQEVLMREHGFLCIIKPEERYAEWIERFADLNPLVIYSLWDGYLDSTGAAYRDDWAAFFEPYMRNNQFVQLHTSGHATAETIANIIETVKPQKKIYPIHTEKAGEFQKLPVKNEYKERIVY